MPVSPQNIQTFFPWAVILPFLWICGWIAASIVYRRSRGKAIYPRKPQGALFYEGAASGNSNRNLLTKLGGARNCLMVSVLKDELTVQPRFPFNLMFLPEIYDLEHRVPRTSIRSIRTGRYLFWNSVEIGFIDSHWSDRSISLMLRAMPEFLKALGGASAGTAP